VNVLNKISKGKNMKIIQEFKEFAMRGNVIDMAVGIIIGAAFGKIVTSFVNDVIMPPIGMLIGGVDFSNLSVVVKEAVLNKPAVVMKYGLFINMIIDFVIVAFVMFMLIKLMNKVMKKKEAAPPPPAEDVVLLTEIRDLLKEK
jgi:large conductance mechanosensitive channel